MDLSSGYPFWLIRGGIPYDYPRLIQDISSDIVIMGGGISGALVAFYLQKAGIDAVVIDGRTIGLGSTCASTSLLQYEIDTPLSELKLLIGDKAATRAYQLCADSIRALQGLSKSLRFKEFSRKKSIYYAAVNKDLPFLEREYNARAQMGISVKWLDSHVLENKYGVLAPAAILSEPAAQTNAYGLTHALHQHNISKGMRIYDRTLITKTIPDKKGVSLVTEEGYKVRCKKLVYATGYETIAEIDKKILRLSSTYAVASEQSNAGEPAWHEGALLWSTADPYLYIRTTDDKRIIVGGRDTDFHSPRKRDALIGSKSNQLVKDFQKLIPGIDFKKEFSWAGTFGSTKDGLPYIGYYHKFPNSLFALGFGGNGITFSLIGARIICDMLKGKSNKDASLFSFDRA